VRDTTTTRYDARRGCARILDPLPKTIQYRIPVLQPSRPQMSKRLICVSSTDGKDPVPQRPYSSWQGQEGNSRPFACLGWLFDGMHHDTIIIFYCYIFCRIRKMNFIRQVTWIYIIIAAWFCEQNSHLAVFHSPVLPFSQIYRTVAQGLHEIDFSVDKITCRSTIKANDCRTITPVATLPFLGNHFRRSNNVALFYSPVICPTYWKAGPHREWIYTSVDGLGSPRIIQGCPSRDSHHQGNISGSHRDIQSIMARTRFSRKWSGNYLSAHHLLGFL
jgi:hypothetical protein